MSWGVKKTFLKEHSFLLMLKFELTRRFRLTKLLQECWLGTPLTAPLQLHTVSCLHPRRCTHHRLAVIQTRPQIPTRHAGAATDLETLNADGRFMTQHIKTKAPRHTTLHAHKAKRTA